MVPTTTICGGSVRTDAIHVDLRRAVLYLWGGVGTQDLPSVRDAGDRVLYPDCSDDRDDRVCSVFPAGGGKLQVGVGERVLRRERRDVRVCVQRVLLLCAISAGRVHAGQLLLRVHGACELRVLPDVRDGGLLLGATVCALPVLVGEERLTN